MVSARDANAATKKLKIRQRTNTGQLTKILSRDRFVSIEPQLRTIADFVLSHKNGLDICPPRELFEQWFIERLQKRARRIPEPLWDFHFPHLERFQGHMPLIRAVLLDTKTAL